MSTHLQITQQQSCTVKTIRSTARECDSVSNRVRTISTMAKRVKKIKKKLRPTLKLALYMVDK